MKLAIRNLEPEAFAPYGEILEPGARPPQGEDKDWRFYVLIEEPGAPWRIGYYVPQIRALGRLERHPTSMETFEPVVGVSVIVVAKDDPESPQAFLLDRPVILHKGTWHGILSLSSRVEIKITENLQVTGEHHYFKQPLEIVVIG